MLESDINRQIQKHTTAMQTKAQGIIDRVLTSQNQYKQAVLTKVNETLANITLGDRKSFDLPLTSRQSAAFKSQQPIQIQQTTQGLDLKLGNDRNHTVKLNDTQRSEIALTSLTSALKAAPKGELITGTRHQSGQITFTYQNKPYEVKSSQTGQAKPVNLLILSQPNQPLHISTLSAKPEQWHVHEKISIKNGQLEYKGKVYEVPANIKSLGNGDFKVVSEQSQSNRQLTVLHNQQKIAISLLPLKTQTPLSSNDTPFKLVSSHYSSQDNKIHLKLNAQSLIVERVVKEDSAKTNEHQHKPLTAVKITPDALTLKVAFGDKIETINIPTKKLIENKSVQSLSEVFIQKVSALNEGLHKTFNPENKNAFEDLFKAIGVKIPTGYHSAPSFKDNLRLLTTQKKDSITIPVTISETLKNQLTELGIFKVASSNLSSSTLSSSSDISIEALQKSISKLDPSPMKAQVSAKIEQLLKQPSNQFINMAESLNHLTAIVKQTELESSPKKITANALNQLSTPKTSIDIQQLISNHLTSQHVLTHANNNASPLNQLALALQVLLTGKMTATKNAKQPNKKNQQTALTKNDHSQNQPRAVNVTNSTTRNNILLKSMTPILAQNQSTPSTKPTQSKTNTAAIEPFTSALAKTIKSQQVSQLKSAQSQIKEHNNLFFQVPIMIDGEFKSVELAINYDIEKDKPDQDNTEKPKSTMVRFSLKFNMGDMGNMLTKASLANNELKLSIYTDNANTLKTCEYEISKLREELNKQAIHLADAQFKQGKIPGHLWNESAIGIQYRV